MLTFYVQQSIARLEEGNEIPLMKFIRKMDKQMEFLRNGSRYGTALLK